MTVIRSMAPDACASARPDQNNDEREQRGSRNGRSTREATGVWMLRSAYLEWTDTRERILPYGDNSHGVLILHEGGRMAAIITPSAQAGDVPQERGSIQPDVGPDRPAAA
jgi:Lipocalin-like domain